jgi:hypothetical protein
LFPLDRRKGIPLKGLQEFFLNTFAIRAVGQDHDPHLLLVNAYRVVPAALIMAFFESEASDTNPRPTIAQSNRVILVRGLCRQGRERVQRIDPYLQA